MNYLVFDTETTGLDKPFCYDVGYNIINENGVVLIRRHFIVEQIWHNLPLFESAYYKEKRQLYVGLLRSRQALLNKWGYIMKIMANDIKRYDVQGAYAYNADFDDKVFTFNCDWYHCNNPLESVPVFDIWGYASQFITNTSDYKQFCESNSFFTDTNNYKATAEVVYRYITGNLDFAEAHMGAQDSDIESTILYYCIKTENAKWNTEYKVNKILARQKQTPYVIKVNGKIIHQGLYIKKYTRNDIYNFTEVGE